MESKNIANMYNTAMYLRSGNEVEEEYDGSDPSANEFVDQNLKCQDFCHENGFEIRDENVYYDFASGALPPRERPDLKALLEAVKEGKITNIVVYRVDRLARGLDTFLRVMKELADLGVTVYSATEEFYIEDLFDHPTWYILNLLNQIENDFLRDFKSELFMAISNTWDKK
jgi:DNA invertase Pin-like site-specific DNA recombinase